MTLYMQVSRDKYELPEIVTDTIQEMAEKSGSTVNCIRSHISHRKAGRLKKDRFIRVEVEEDDEQDSDLPYMWEELRIAKEG